MELKGTQSSQNNFENKIERLTLLGYKTAVMKTMWNWHKDKDID